MLAALVLVLAVVVTLAFAVELICLVLALYELLNGEAQSLRLEAATVLPALATVVVESVTFAAYLLVLPFGSLRPRRQSPAAVAPPPDGGEHAAAARRPLLVFVATWPLGGASFAIMRQRLRDDGWTDSVALRSPLLGADLHAAARSVQRGVERAVATDPARRVILVAHGTGGLVCRAYLRWCDGVGRVDKLVTLASPHGGSKLYALAMNRLLWELRPESEVLRDLADDDPIPRTVECTAIYSSFDLSILPSRLAYYPGAGNIEVEGVGHFSMLWSRRVHELVRENLEYVAPRAAGSDRAPAA